MYLATPECKLTGFLASSWFLVKLARKLASNSEFILNKIKPNTVRANTELTLIPGLAYSAQNSPLQQTAFHEIAGKTVTEVAARRAPQSSVEEKNDDQVEL